MHTNSFRIALALTLLAAATLSASAQPISIGAPPSLFDDMSAGQKKFVADEFPGMLREFTGLDATLTRRDSLDLVGKNLAAGTDQFAILQGVEYGWLKEKHPEIKPLVIAVYHVTRPRAKLLTKADDPAKSFADLKGKSITLLKAGKASIYLFGTKGADGDLAKFFGKIGETSNAEAALDDILLGKSAAAIVDEVSLDNYRDVNPGRFARLRVVEESPPFPPMAIFCVPAKTAPDVVEKFRAGMLSANKSARSRDSMATFKITAFAEVPKEYPSWVADIVKAFPEARAK